MRSVAPIALLALLVLPYALAASPPPRDDATSVADPSDPTSTLYVNVCRVHGAIPEDPVDACASSGVWRESNNVEGLQSRSGVFNGKAYIADTDVVPNL